LDVVNSTEEKSLDDEGLANDLEDFFPGIKDGTYKKIENE
jgi:hypothetical protein